MNLLSSKFPPILKSNFSPKVTANLQPLILADFMRPLSRQNNATSSMQNVLVRKLQNWFEPALSQVFKKPVNCGIWEDGVLVTFPAREIYSNHNLDPSTQGWIQIYRATPTKDDVKHLQPYVEGSFVIGFELSPFICSLLDILEVPYVSLAIHPLRFMRDYVFMLASNFTDFEEVRSFLVNPDNIAFAAQLRKASLRQTSDFIMPEGSAVLFGQVEIDAALIAPRGVISLQDHIAPLRELCAAHERVYFKPHPYGSNGSEQAMFLRQFPNIEYVSHNAYSLLSATEVTTVAALTSSVLSEAPYFNKVAHPLSTIWVDRSREPAYGLEILSPQFWQALVSAKPASPSSSALTDVTLKTLLNVSWESFGAGEVSASGVEVVPGKNYIFGKGQDGDRFCRGAGWQPAASDHRWTKTRGAFLSFRVPLAKISDFKVKLTLNGVATGEFPILAQVWCKGQILKEISLQSLAQTTIEFELPRHLASAIGDFELELVASHAHAPATLTVSDDRRGLALCVRNLTVGREGQGLPAAIGQTLLTRDIPPITGCLAKGWHMPESNGVWLNGRHGQIRLLKSPVPDMDMRLRLGNVRALLSDLLEKNVLTISVADRLLGSYKFCRLQPGDIQVGGVDIEVTIPREAFLSDGELLTIDIGLIASHSPKMAGYSNDHRDLGVMVESLTLIPEIRAHAGAAVEHVANIFGPFNIHTGLAVMARNVFRAIDEAQAERAAANPKKARYGPRAVNFNNSHHIDQETGFVRSGDSGSAINIFCGDVVRIAKIVATCGNDILQNHYNVCYGAWELETMPTYLANTQYIQEYWGLSTFIADGARARMDVPVHALPIPVELCYPKSISHRSRFAIPEDRFVFLFTFSVDSTLARKNPEGVFDAFQAAFPNPSEPVALVVKSMIRQASVKDRTAYAAFKARAEKDPRVIFIEETLTREENASLYMQCDAYVSLHRAEGFGLTMAEAMGYGKPTIGTGYSGNLDFMTSETSCLVDYRLIEMDTQDYHNQTQYWAEPDIGDAAQHMRRVFSDILFREKIARAGKRVIHDQFSIEAVGRKILERIHEIEMSRG